MTILKHYLKTLIIPAFSINKRKAVRILTFVLASVFFAQAQAQFFNKKQPVLLPEEQAFDAIANVSDGVLSVNWSIADDYYMYRDQFRIESDNPDVTIGEITFPKGEIEDDPEFGVVEVYFYNVEFTAPISGPLQSVELTLRGQGCNKPVGVCYPPQARRVSVIIDKSSEINPAAEQVSQNAVSDSGSTSKSTTADNSATNSTKTKSFWSYIVTALGAGILLSFTPCVLPMIPILAGVIAGQNNPSKLRSGWLAICYVAGTIVTYAIAGWVAGAAGTQLQAHFQNPWVIGFICALLLILAASLFGWFKIQLPSGVQSKLNSTNVKSRSASVSSFALGLISALVVGACVSPILIVTLGAAITQGDPVLGAGIMAAMAAGMGLLLIAFGFGAGWILPKTGAWMEQIQVIFGFMVIGVAIFLASTLDSVATLYFWSGLLLCTGFYLWNLAQEIPSALANSTARALSFAAILWGAMALIGGTTGGNDILRPLDSIQLSNANVQQNARSINFQTTTNVNGAKQLLSAAKSAGQPVVVDFYADWCLDCKRMHRTTFKDNAVIDALETWAVIEIDVTDTNADSEAVKKYFSVFGPPATLFYRNDGSENTELRQYGYLKSADFLNLLARTNN